MSRSWTSAKTEMKDKKTGVKTEEVEAVEVGDKSESVNETIDTSKNLSSSSNDPGSSSNANTNSR